MEGGGLSFSLSFFLSLEGTRRPYQLSLCLYLTVRRCYPAPRRKASRRTFFNSSLFRFRAAVEREVEREREGVRSLFFLSLYLCLTLSLHPSLKLVVAFVSRLFLFLRGAESRRFLFFMLSSLSFSL